MFGPSDDLSDDLFDELGPIQTPLSLQNLLEESDSNEELQINPAPPEIILNNNNTTSYGFSPDLNTSEDPSIFISQAAFVPPEPRSSSPEHLTIIAQPHCTTRVRYRTEYLPPKKRRDALANINSDSSYTGPAVQIPSKYLDRTKQLFIGISLATLMHEKSRCYRIHPYELESIDDQSRNDRPNNIVWYPVEKEEDRIGLKSFSDLRIVRSTEDELEHYGNLRPFHGIILDANLSDDYGQQALSTRQLVVEYNLKRGHLVFFIGEIINENDVFPTITEPFLVFSEEMILVPDRTAGEGDTSVESTAASNSSPPPDCGVDKYAPRCGSTAGGEEMLIFLTKKLEERKYGKLQITFQSNAFSPEWSVMIEAKTIEVKDQMVSFRTPKLTFAIDTSTIVNVILQQRDRFLGLFEYTYVPRFQCATCQATSINIPNPFAQSHSNKRTRSSRDTHDDQSDAIVPVHTSSPVLQQTKSEPGSTSSNSTLEPSTNTNQHENLLLKKLNENIESLFLKNDYKPLLRTCRLHIHRRPELLHGAISNDYSELVSTFISVAKLELMQKKNEHGETVLLHAARLGRLQIIKAVLEIDQSDKLLEDTNKKEQNIFHILALNTESEEILDFIISHLLKKSISIAEKFDYDDEDNHTPLQLAVLHNNLPVARHLLKYFDKNVYEMPNDINENLVHLAVRHGDLTMLKYLLSEGQLIGQGNQTSLFMTPMELAQSMKHNDMVDYLKKIYPPPEVNEDEDSEND